LDVWLINCVIIDSCIDSRQPGVRKVLFGFSNPHVVTRATKQSFYSIGFVVMIHIIDGQAHRSYLFSPCQKTLKAKSSCQLHRISLKRIR